MARTKSRQRLGVRQPYAAFLKVQIAHHIQSHLIAAVRLTRAAAND
jgi:hypothetical protein